MAGFSLSPGRARAARITSALALMLALAAVFGGATASAAPSTTELTCGPDEPLAGSTVTCKVVVTGAEASRTLRFEQIGFAEFKPRTCTLLPLNKTSVFCVARFRVLAPGRLTVFATYLSATEENFSSDSHDFLVKPGGSINVECSPEFGFVGDLSDCEVVVPNTPGVSESPSGLVQFRSLSEFLGESAGRVTPECTLEPTPSGARCSLRFEPSFAGTAALIAEYEGDATHPAQFGSVPYLVFEKHETKTSAKCDNPTPLKGIAMRCTVSVASLDETGGPPTGFVEFEEGDRANGNFVGGSSCRLEADEEKASESSCSVIYKPSKVGPQVLEVQFLGSARFDFGEPAFIELDVQPILRLHETRTSAKCDEHTPVTKTTVTCTVSVVNLDETGGGPPTGRVDFTQFGTENGTFLGLKFCDLEAKDEFGSESFCTFRYEPLKLGPQVLRVQFRGDEHFQGGEPVSIGLEVVGQRSTSTGLSCLPSRGLAPGICLVTVTDTSAKPASAAPSGTVKLNVPSTVKLNRETCDLAPIATGASASCAFSYTMTTIGSTPVIAEYFGDARGHLPSSGKGTASRQS